MTMKTTMMAKMKEPTTKVESSDAARYPMVKSKADEASTHLGLANWMKMKTERQPRHERRS
jgi:hypothetical protein